MLELEIDNRLFKVKEPHKNIKCTLKDKIDFGFCPINQTTVRTFDIYNPNDYSVDFSLQALTVIVNPDSGILGPK